MGSSSRALLTLSHGGANAAESAAGPRPPACETYQMPWKLHVGTWEPGIWGYGDLGYMLRTRKAFQACGRRHVRYLDRA